MHVTALVSWFERVTVIMWSAKLCKWICYIYCVHVWQAIQRQNQRNKQLSLWFPSRHYLSLLTLNLQVVFLKTTGHKFVIQSYNTFNNSNNNNKSLLPTYPFSPTMTLQQPTFFLLILAQTPVQHPWHLYIHAAMISLVDPIFSVCYCFARFSRNHMYAPSPFLTICFPGHISHTCMCSVWWNETHSWPVNCHCWNNVGMYFSFSLKKNNNKNKQTNK